jgi:hypothetical protein
MVQGVRRALRRRGDRVRRFPGRCYFCGDPVVVGTQFCVAHLWAQGIESVPERKVSRKKLREAVSWLTPPAVKR